MRVQDTRSENCSVTLGIRSSTTRNRATTGNVAREPCPGSLTMVARNECHKIIVPGKQRPTDSLERTPDDEPSPGYSNMTIQLDLRDAGKFRIRFDDSELGALRILHCCEPPGSNIYRRDNHRGTSALLCYCLDQRLHVAHRKRPAPVTPRCVAMSLGYMVIDEEALVPAIVIGLHSSVHVDVTRVDELL